MRRDIDREYTEEWRPGLRSSDCADGPTSIHFCKQRFSGVTDLVAWRVASLTRPQKPRELLQRDAELDRVLDEPDPIDDVVRIKSVAGSRSQRLWQHALTFVVPHGVGADACTSRRFADGKDIWRHPDSIKAGVAPRRTPAGARVRMMSTNNAAIAAIHDFLAYQIREHQTGDPVR